SLFAAGVRRAMGGIEVRVVGRPDKEIRRVALCTGSGASLIDLVSASGCDAYVTGDVKYHEAQTAVEADLALIDVGHFASERIVVEPLAANLQAMADRSGEAVAFLIAKEESDPFWRGGE
ncbi:MAG: Nif3-like dinuclear metal center hexameric protein, partial [Acidobacteriota bacterium]